MAGIGEALGSFAGGVASGMAAGGSKTTTSSGGTTTTTPSDQSWFDRLKSNVGKLKRAFGSDAGGTANPEGAPGTPAGGYPVAHKGGRIKKTGIYRMQKNEVVIPADVVSRIEGRSKGKRKASRKSSRGGGR